MYWLIDFGIMLDTIGRRRKLRQSVFRVLSYMLRKNADCDAPKQTLVEQAEKSVRLAPGVLLSSKRSAFKKCAGI